MSEPIFTPRGLKIRIPKADVEQILDELEQRINLDRDLYCEVEMWVDSPAGFMVFAACLTAPRYHSWYLTMVISFAAYCVSRIGHDYFYWRPFSIFFGLFFGSTAGAIISGVVVSVVWLRHDEWSSLLALWSVILAGTVVSPLMEIAALPLVLVTGLLTRLSGRPERAFLTSAPERAFLAILRRYKEQFSLPDEMWVISSGLSSVNTIMTCSGK